MTLAINFLLSILMMKLVKIKYSKVHNQHFNVNIKYCQIINI